ncbi:hypothetical protein JN01_0124 [Entomoplasma freundtii]|uniref:Probable cell division protein WhiA n=1 Tax=Entomoplasma freundtii TaxID=74700 RepID=A0A2K8NS28_9MOLU|nr:DNA-binding protein WhiA [Entomoplasma freundtii]ATZ16655.1 DNA-binding protein WhiA [Entomoplasma freundtii]TDY58178.1 hypothetical protein JN01_0124 [Entomoplasma freundtii]
MSFALEVKEEILTHSFSQTQKRALLSGLVKANGELVYNQKGESLRLTTISNRVARTLIIFTKEFFQGSLEIAIIQKKSLKKNKTFQLTLKGNLEDFFTKLAINPLETELTPLPCEWVSDVNILRAYVAGLFIGAGSVNSPETSNYHLEIQFKSLAEADQFNKLMVTYDFVFKILSRKNERFISYLKKSAMVSDFIKFLDAPQSVLKFENIRISRDMVNNINRIQNIDISNQTRTIAASEGQIKAIKLLKSQDKLESLSEKAQSLAQLRVKYPDASYQELSQKMQKSGYNITKSGISNLFRQILKFANYH